jgi:DNA replication and repair protein RecF
MLFKSVSLENFRNYESLTLSFDPKLNLFLGQNAQGKTNLLESLFIMGLGRSFRTNKDRDMIAFGKDYSKATCLVEDESGDETEIKIVYQKEGKIIHVDGVKLDRSIDLLENIYIVVFSPDDLRIIKDGPDNRRRFLDRELCQIKPVYYSDLGNYKKVLKQRNMLIRQNSFDKELLAVFDEALADYGLRLSDERQRFTGRLMEISHTIHESISGGRESLVISYESRMPDKDLPAEERKELYKRKLEEEIERDIYNGFTSFGPHKDDLKIEVNGTDIRQFGSQGQQRTAALSMKLAEIGLIKQETGKNAVLLLDDVLSELDQNRQQYLIEAMKDIQVFITATEIDPLLRVKLPEGRTFLIEDGYVKLLT